MSEGFPPGFNWDEAKNQSNIAKHGIDFRDAVRVFEKPTLDKVDERRDYGEERVNSLGDLDGQIIANVMHTGRDGETRLLSARPAKEPERRAYREFIRALELGKPQPGRASTRAGSFLTLPTRLS